LWARGDMGSATDRIETALALRSLRDSTGQSEDLRVLSLLYYAQGDLESGGLALREAMRRGNVLANFGSNAMLWLAAVVILLAVHLLGESRHGAAQSSQGGVVTQPSEPHMWSVGQAYGVFVASALTGLAAALIYSALVYQNLLALFTPLQQQEARAVYFAVFALVAAALTWQRARQAGIDPAERLLGSSSQITTGLLLGLAFVAVVIGYFMWTERGGAFGGFFLDLSRPTVFAVVALALLPLSELFFRGFYYPSLARRYGPGLAVLASGLIFAIAFGTPVLLLVVVGVVLSEIYRRRANGLLVLSAVLVGWVGLVVAAGLSPFVRSLFFY
jgi:membrane protease YdiL (CAAX protease family)